MYIQLKLKLYVLCSSLSWERKRGEKKKETDFPEHLKKDRTKQILEVGYNANICVHLCQRFCKHHPLWWMLKLNTNRLYFRFKLLLFKYFIVLYVEGLTKQTYA